MTWGNHQPRTGLIEAAFQRALLLRLKADEDWCYKCHEHETARPCIIRHPDGRVKYFNSIKAASRFIGCSDRTVRQNKSAYGWKIEK